MQVRQLFERTSSTYTYLVYDHRGGEAVLIDTVIETVDRDLELVESLELDLKYVLDTHVHADHITGAGQIREQVGAQSVISAEGGVACVDLAIAHGHQLKLTNFSIEARATPGHTNSCMSYVLRDDQACHVFTGDTLLIGGCGRTDFQQGNPHTLYHSVHEHIFSLPDDCLVWPAHDYRGFSHSTVGEEKRHNSRLRLGTSEAEFVEIMRNLKLDNPKLMDIAVPANLGCGLKAPDAAPEYAQIGPAELANIEGYVLIDVRQPAEFIGELGHIEGAQLVPLAELESTAKNWERDRHHVLVCRSGRRSAVSCQTLKGMGFNQLSNLEGGMLAYRAYHGLDQEDSGGCG